MIYQPAPLDNSSIELSTDLQDLVELLAHNNHDLWAKHRMEEGWSWGPHRDDKKKETPMLIPYGELPESEKHYDRQNALETLKTIVNLGWTIEDPRQLAQAVPTLEEYQRKAKQANAEGEAIRACDISGEGLKLWPGDLKLRQMQALALAQMGSLEKSYKMLEELQSEGHKDEETHGLLARTYKDLWLRSGNVTALDQAYSTYLTVFRMAPASYWTGINAAALALVIGDGQTARDLARQVARICSEVPEQAPNSDPYWLNATRAEACLILESLPEAEQLYTVAGTLGRERLGDVMATWGNARLISSLLDSRIADRIARALGVPQVVVFAGHRVDEPGAASPRFPEERVEAVKERIKERLLDTCSRFGYSSAASGADILFLEAMQSIGGRTYIVLPCDEAQFLQESVASSGEHWVERFQAVKAAATEVIVSSHERLNLGSVAYDFSNELLYGLANMRAKQFGTELVHLAVWNGRDATRRGGTADILKRWRTRTSDVIILRPVDAGYSGEQNTKAEPGVFGESEDNAFVGFGSEIRAMLFADAYHFSRLAEAQMPFFIRHFTGAIALLVNQTRPRPLFQNTWGDGLYIVFSTVLEAARFALNLAKRVASIDRKSANLPPDMTLRIALHIGPVYRYRDQIIDKVNYIGSHVNRAARIEPVTPPGQIYATDAFAALAELEGPNQFQFDYVGRTPLAKGFGAFPMYNMRQKE